MKRGLLFLLAAVVLSTSAIRRRSATVSSDEVTKVSNKTLPDAHVNRTELVHQECKLPNSQSYLEIMRFSPFILVLPGHCWSVCKSDEECTAVGVARRNDHKVECKISYELEPFLDLETAESFVYFKGKVLKFRFN